MNIVITGCKIVTIKSDDKKIQFPSHILQKFNLDIKRAVSLKFGGLSVSVKAVEVLLNPLHTGDKIFISKNLSTDLGLPHNVTLSVKQTSDNQLQLGPVVGILTFRHIVDRRSFGHYVNYHRHLPNGLLFVFGSHGINTNNHTITGYRYNEAAKTWEEGSFPYPDAVIDLCYPNAYRAHQALEEIIGKGRIFNKKTLLNKVDFYNALKEDPFLTRHIPETQLLTSSAALDNFLSRHREVFLKPVNGMQGKGIVKASLYNNKLRCLYNFKGTRTEAILDTHEIFDLLKELTSARSQYIIQNAIPRMEYKGNPFCFRTMTCKNESGQWVAPAIFPKAAPDNGFLTNHASGARFVPLKALFKDLAGKLPCSKTEFISQLVALSLKTASALDQKYGPLGKIGIDTVVDQSGKPWLIEANGNPGPVPASHLIEFPHWSYQSFRLPLSYAAYLAGFKS